MFSRVLVCILMGLTLLVAGPVKQRFADLGTEPVPEKRATLEARKAHLKSELDKWP